MHSYIFLFIGLFFLGMSAFTWMQGNQIEKSVHTKETYFYDGKGVCVKIDSHPDYLFENYEIVKKEKKHSPKEK